MKALKPIIETVEPDKYGRTVKVGIQDGSYSTFLQVMSIEEVKELRDELTKFLSKNTKYPSYFETLLDSVKAGTIVKVRFEEFGMPDKHIPGRVIHPKRVYRSIKVEERRGQHLSGMDVDTNRSSKFHIEQITEVL